MRCICCGVWSTSGQPICLYHLDTPKKDWAKFNRIMCDFFHRGVPLPRVRDGKDHEWDLILAAT